MLKSYGRALLLPGYLIFAGNLWLFFFFFSTEISFENKNISFLSNQGMLFYSVPFVFRLINS